MQNNLKFLDEKDKIILNLLQKNSRESLTNLSREVGLSIDSTNKRMKKLVEKGIISKFGIFVDPIALGFPLVVDIKIKLQNITEEQYNKFINYLKNHARVIELLSIAGDYDITCVFISKNSEELEKISKDVRETFPGLIADWRSVFVLKVHKFEEYNL